MKIKVLCVHSPEYQQLADITLPSKKEYADRHGFEFVSRQHSLPFSWWQRPEIWLEELKTCDWLFFTGVDTLITNLTVDIRKYMEPAARNTPAVDFVCAIDCYGLQDDVFLMRNTDDTRRLLKNLRAYDGRVEHEQHAFNIELSGRPEFWGRKNPAAEVVYPPNGVMPTDDVYRAGEKFLNGSRVKVKVVPQRNWNAYPYGPYGGTNMEPNTWWHPGDFILHLPGTSMELRLKLFPEYLHQIVREPLKFNRYFHTGDLGDIIASLPAVRASGGGEYVIGAPPLPLGVGSRETMKGKRFDAIKPLLDAQPYIRDTVWEETPGLISHDMSLIRTSQTMPDTANIAERYSRWLGLTDVDYSPWLDVEPSPETAGRVIVIRTGRYHNPTFPWQQVMDRLGDRALFIGLPDEHKSFERYTGHQVEFWETDNLLEAAQLIAGAELTISNSTSLFWVAIGVGAKVIQEVNPIIAVVRCPNAFYPQTPEEYQAILERLEEMSAAVVRR
jgi:hypothetical protein